MLYLHSQYRTTIVNNIILFAQSLFHAVQCLTPSQRQIGRPKVHWHDSIMKWTGLSGRSLEDRTQWRKIVHEAVNPLIEKTEQQQQQCLTNFLKSMFILWLVHFMVHGSLFAVTHAPFMHQCWGLHHRLAQCMRPQGGEVS